MTTELWVLLSCLQDLKTITRINSGLSSRPLHLRSLAQEIPTRLEFQTPPLGFHQILKEMRGIKGLELDRDVETGDEAGPGAVHASVDDGGRRRGAVDAGGDWTIGWWIAILGHR